MTPRNLNHTLHPIDWVVIGLYLVVLLGVGWYYSRRTVTAEDYLLGGRRMKSWRVGLSLFASLLSTISFLAWPGEMIRYGPLFMGGCIAYPFIILFVGWILIPRIMELPVTSAYEILERRLGLGPRLLGAGFFLAMRLIWMSVILYATAEKALIPMLEWDPKVSPYVCAALGTVTVLYTSFGGLRAVVMTDVIQSIVLLSGAFLTLGIITYDLGGVGAWWPLQWMDHWPEPVFGYDPSARMSLVGMSIAVFTWYICTSGSDQMAVQRYLATRNPRQARKSLTVSICSDATVMLLMGFVGLSLLSYFRLNPGLIPEGKTLVESGDVLFTRFIVFGLPQGITGLVVAGLLSAAMSSLSSGLNSSCSVILTDFIDRFFPSEISERDRIRRAITVSILVGVVVVTLSTAVGVVKGNLLEVTFKTVNLVTAPLAGLFFLAFFVPWASSIGAVIAGVGSLGVVIAVNYWEFFTGNPGISFIWALPLGLVSEMAIGMVASLIFPKSRVPIL